MTKTSVKLSEITSKKDVELQCQNGVVLTIKQGISVQDQIDFANALTGIEMNELKQKTPEIAFNYISDWNIVDDDWKKVPLDVKTFLQLRISFEDINEILNVSGVSDLVGWDIQKKNTLDDWWEEKISA